jgi:hypothetical protein
MEKTIKMIRRVGGIMGELGRGPCPEKKLNVEILAVGPMFQELDMRELYQDTKKTPFCRYAPQAAPY